jgi:hypothetical protein
MAALPGNPEDYQQDKDGRWFHPEHPGLITLAEPLTFAEYYARRAEPEAPPIDKIADLEARIAALEATAIAAP